MVPTLSTKFIKLAPDTLFVEYVLDKHNKPLVGSVRGEYNPARVDPPDDTLDMESSLLTPGDLEVLLLGMGAQHLRLSFGTYAGTHTSVEIQSHYSGKFLTKKETTAVRHAVYQAQ